MTESISQLQESHFSRLQEVVLGALAISPNVSLATANIHMGLPRSHSFEAWLDVPDDSGLRKVRLFSSAGRLHSQDIVAYGTLSGSIAIPQKLSNPVQGATFEAVADIVPAKSEYRQQILESWISRGLFTPNEIDKYLDPSAADKNAGVRPHEVYEGEVTMWSMMDSVSQQTNPDVPRLFIWGGDSYHCPLPQDGTLHQTGSPHLHLPLPWQMPTNPE